MIKLKRLCEQPILLPRAEHEWEKSAVFNCAAIYRNNQVHLIYRATDLPCHESYGKYVSTFGYAVSNDGIKFEQDNNPVFVGEGPQETRGVEDPRIVEIDGIYYMVYVGFGGRFDGDFRISLATSVNLKDWVRHGVMLDEPNKDASLFPQKIKGRYVLLHRRFPDIWLAFSEDLKNWTEHSVIMRPIPDTWEENRIGIAGPPIPTPNGWVLIYHAADNKNVYRLGVALLDYEDPRKVLARQKEPIFEPELDWEIKGWVPNVVFSNGHIVKDDMLYLYYGGADTRIGVAGIELSKLLAL